jgi:hypothetical protein
MSDRQRIALCAMGVLLAMWGFLTVASPNGGTSSGRLAISVLLVVVGGVLLWLGSREKVQSPHVEPEQRHVATPPSPEETPQTPKGEGEFFKRAEPDLDSTAIAGGPWPDGVGRRGGRRVADLKRKDDSKSGS